jgi:hypothetical protein
MKNQVQQVSKSSISTEMFLSGGDGGMMRWDADFSLFLVFVEAKVAW